MKTPGSYLDMKEKISTFFSPLIQIPHLQINNLTKILVWEEISNTEGEKLLMS